MIFFYKSNVKNNRIWVYDSNHKMLKVLDSVGKTFQYYSISFRTVDSYIMLNKLYK